MSVIHGASCDLAEGESRFGIPHAHTASLRRRVLLEQADEYERRITKRNTEAQTEGIAHAGE